MSLAELENAVAQLSKDDLNRFNAWYEEYVAEQWDRRIEADVLAGKFDAMCKRADAAFEAGECTEMK